jgi:hypothetical protein
MPRLGNNETVVPVKVDTGWLELRWPPVAGTHGTLKRAPLAGYSLNISCIRQNDSD